LADRGLKVDYRTVWKFVHAAGLSFKQRASKPPNSNGLTSPVGAPGWKKYQGRLDPRRLVFIDETRTKTNMAPLRGWGLKGKRLPSRAPHGHWQTMTFLAALRHRIVAPCVFDGPINGLNRADAAPEIDRQQGAIWANLKNG
jgi:hypothetical protein